MENQLINQSLILIDIMTTLKQILQQIKNNNINEEFYNNLYQVIDKTTDATLLFLMEMRATVLNANTTDR